MKPVFMETLDKFDLLILQELQADGRLTNTELAQRVGLSAAPCWRRVRALEEAGYIKGYHAEIDRHRIGLGVLAFVRLDADRNTGEGTRAMEEAIRVFAGLGAKVETARARPMMDGLDIKVVIAESELFAVHYDNLVSRPSLQRNKTSRSPVIS